MGIEVAAGTAADGDPRSDSGGRRGVQLDGRERQRSCFAIARYASSWALRAAFLAPCAFLTCFVSCLILAATLAFTLVGTTSLTTVWFSMTVLVTVSVFVTTSAGGKIGDTSLALRNTLKTSWTEPIGAVQSDSSGPTPVTLPRSRAGFRVLFVAVVPGFVELSLARMFLTWRPLSLTVTSM